MSRKVKASKELPASGGGDADSISSDNSDIAVLDANGRPQLFPNQSVQGNTDFFVPSCDFMAAIWDSRQPVAGLKRPSEAAAELLRARTTLHKVVPEEFLIKLVSTMKMAIGGMTICKASLRIMRLMKSFVDKHYSAGIAFNQPLAKSLEEFAIVTARTTCETLASLLPVDSNWGHRNLEIASERLIRESERCRMLTEKVADASPKYDTNIRYVNAVAAFFLATEAFMLADEAANMQYLQYMALTAAEDAATGVVRVPQLRSTVTADADDTNETESTSDLTS